MSSFKMKEQRSKGQRSKGHYSSEFSIPLFLTIQVRIFANQVRIKRLAFQIRLQFKFKILHFKLVNRICSSNSSFTVQVHQNTPGRPTGYSSMAFILCPTVPVSPTRDIKIMYLN